MLDQVEVKKMRKLIVALLFVVAAYPAVARDSMSKEDIAKLPQDKVRYDQTAVLQ